MFQLPGKYGKGVLVSPTVHGNLLLGPTAKDIGGKEDTATTAPGLQEVLEKSALGVKNIPTRQVITSFAGLRAHEDGDDFVLGESAPGFFDAAGHRVPGPFQRPRPSGRTWRGLIGEKLGLPENPDFDPIRRGVPHVKDLPVAERAALIQKDPAYGQIVCRCEEVSYGGNPGRHPRHFGGQDPGRCQAPHPGRHGPVPGGVLLPRVMDLLSQELGLDLTDIRKSGKESQIVLEKTRGEV